MHFFTLNSNKFPEFLYHPHLSLSDRESNEEGVGQTNNNTEYDPAFAGVCSSNEPNLLTKGDLNDIVRDLNLSKKQAELSDSRLKRDLPRQNTKVCFYRGRHEEFKDFFSQEDGGVFCNDVCSVIKFLAMNIIQISGVCLFISQK
jgi:hypothetical protein